MKHVERLLLSEPTPARNGRFWKFRMLGRRASGIEMRRSQPVDSRILREIMTGDSMSTFEDFLLRYSKNVKDGFQARWVSYTPKIYHNEISEVIGGLIARQATLAIEIARNPGIWNAHIAPIMLRVMTDTHITLAWILKDPETRSKEYIKYGLGQERLYVEYLENESDQLPAEEQDEALGDLLKYKRAWINSQVLEWSLDINVGSWSGKTTREMAQEAHCESLYKFAYVPFSATVHSMWHHVGRLNMVRCENVLHKNHRIPVVPDLLPDLDYLYRSAKYVSRSLSAFSESLNITTDIPLPEDFFIEKYPFSKNDDENENDVEKPSGLAHD